MDPPVGSEIWAPKKTPKTDLNWLNRLKFNTQTEGLGTLISKIVCGRYMFAFPEAKKKWSNPTGQADLRTTFSVGFAWKGEMIPFEDFFLSGFGAIMHTL